MPAPLTLEATSAAGATVTFGASANDAVDGPVATSCSPASGGTFSMGITMVTCNATDAAGNVGYGSFSVTVRDTTPPVLTLLGDLTLEATSPAGAVATFAATASDIVNGSRPVACMPASGATLPLGTTTVACNAADLSGNTSAGSFTATVRDTTAPAVSAPAALSVAATEAGGVRAAVSSALTAA